MHFVLDMIHLCANEYLSPTEEFKGQSLNKKQYSENNSHLLQQTSIIQKKGNRKSTVPGGKIQRRKMYHHHLLITYVTSKTRLIRRSILFIFFPSSEFPCTLSYSFSTFTTTCLVVVITTHSYLLSPWKQQLEPASFRYNTRQHAPRQRAITST